MSTAYTLRPLTALHARRKITQDNFIATPKYFDVPATKTNPLGKQECLAILGIE